jgi:hypothetical protein
MNFEKEKKNTKKQLAACDVGRKEGRKRNTIGKVLYFLGSGMLIHGKMVGANKEFVFL